MILTNTGSDIALLSDGNTEFMKDITYMWDLKGACLKQFHVYAFMLLNYLQILVSINNNFSNNHIVNQYSTLFLVILRVDV